MDTPTNLPTGFSSSLGPPLRPSRTRGSLRKARRRDAQRHAWVTQGLRICSLNCAGINDLKLLLLLETETPDVLCL